MLTRLIPTTNEKQCTVRLKLVAWLDVLSGTKDYSQLCTGLADRFYMNVFRVSMLQVKFDFR